MSEDYTLYYVLNRAGIEMQNHYSDLYFPKTDETTSILNKFPDLAAIATTFVNNRTNMIWYEVPFAYTPYWKDREVVDE